MDRYRLISGIVVLLVYLLAMFPVQTIVVAIVIAIAYFVLTNMPGRIGEVSNYGNGKEVRRRQALKDAKIYLSPYNSIWKNLKLSNKYCILRLGSDGLTITAQDKIVTGRSFRVLHSKIHEQSDLWDMFCKSFEHNTTFDRLLELCQIFNVDTTWSIVKDYEQNISKQPKLSQDTTNNISTDVNIPKCQVTKKEKLDINNASEVELTALPGISIVMAKKLIKKRDELRGFKSVDDVCLFLHLKPHMENQVRNLICVKKMRGVEKIKRYNERSIDL